MRHFLNGIEITPRNIGEIGIISDFTERPNVLEMNVSTVTLPREAYDIVKQHILTAGLFTGIPYSTQSSSGKVIDYYIDLAENPIFKSFETDVTLKKYKGRDSFMDQANATSFELMNSRGVIFSSFDCPYIIVKDNQAELAITLAISLYIMTKELIDQTKVLVGSITDLIGAVTPNVGVGVTFDIGDIIGLVLKVIAQIAFVALLIVAIVKLGQQLFDLLFPKVRYLKGVKVKELILKGCQHLGYTFNSTLLDSISGLTIMPIPLQKQGKKWFEFFQNELNQSFNKGYPTANDSTPNLGDLIQAVEKMFNAKTKVLNGNVRIERRDYWANISPNSVQVSLNMQDSRDNAFTYNTEDSWKRYVISYTPDISDLHTFDDFSGNDAEYSCEPTNVSDTALTTIKGVVNINLDFALGKRKKELNWVERQAKELFEKIDDVASFFGGNSSLVSKIEARKGVLMISQQYFTKTKLLYTIGGKQPESYMSYLSAGVLWRNYHSINQIQVNGYRVIEDARCRINDSDFVSLIENNFAEIDGQICEILSIEYVDADTSNTESTKTLATISYKIPDNYAQGKVRTLTINE